MYVTAKEAAIAYDRAVLKANQSISLLNFPDMVHNLDVEPKRKKYKGSATGYRGVSEDKKSGNFLARISIGNRLGDKNNPKQHAAAELPGALNVRTQERIILFW
jgi:hypothetical protein